VVCFRATVFSGASAKDMGAVKGVEAVEDVALTSNVYGSFAVVLRSVARDVVTLVFVQM